MNYREHLDYLPLHTGGPITIYNATRPPCNEPISTSALLYASIATSLISAATSAAISYSSAQTAAKQSEYNAEAQQKAIGIEQQRQAAQEAENQRRAAQQQREQRAMQLNAMAGSGAMLGTGTPLSLEADTWAKQQIEMADQQRVADLAQRQLAYEGYSAGIMGKQQAAAYRREGTGAVISGLASMASTAAGAAYSTRVQAQPKAYNYKTGQPMAASTNIP
jgi:hypothetical protein